MDSFDHFTNLRGCRCIFTDNETPSREAASQQLALDAKGSKIKGQMRK